ncbi:MAG: hypothetical protein AB1757_20690 [Acidobacteriota bacterium]
MNQHRQNHSGDSQSSNQQQRGTATLTAVLIMGLLAIFVAASLSKVTTEALVMGNDYSHTQAFYASQASLELMSRDFNNIFDVQLRPTAADITRIENNQPDIAGFTFIQDVTQDAASTPKPIDDGPFSGLISIRTPWRLTSVATYAGGAQAQLTRTFFNHQIPLFQFGIFYNDDMELHPGPVFNFGGRVHSNRHIFMMSGNNLYFNSRVTAAGEIIRDTSRMGARTGDPGWSWNGNVYVADAAGVNQLVTVGSVKKASGVQAGDADMPNWTPNTTWSSDSAKFNGNLLAHQKLLKLPLQIGTNNDPIELVKRGKDTDNTVLRDSRFYNKPCIRVTLSDSQSRLPGGTGGVRLDGAGNGAGGASGSRTSSGDGTRGYEPVAMSDGYQAKRVNGNRLYTGASYTSGGMPATRETWIKIEVVTVDPSTYNPIAVDATADFLSLGITHKNPSGLNIGDARAIFKLQRYEITGPPIKVPAGNINGGSNTSTTAAYTNLSDPRDFSSRPAYTYSSSMNFVATSQLDTAPSPYIWRVSNAAASATEGTAQSATYATAATSFEQTVTVGSTTYRVVPFPIKMYSSREGLYSEDLPSGSSGSPGNAGSPTWWYYYTGTSPGNSLGTTAKVPVNGVLSVVDIDMANLGAFIRGDFDGLFPANGGLPGGSLSSDDISDNSGAGTIVYVSDRRGDADNDGEFDMEDIYGRNDGVIQPGEDVNRNGALDVDYTWEAARYDVGIETDLAALTDHKYFRRAVRAINGQSLIGSTNTGYTIATENGFYTLGNYNATGVSAGPTASAPTQPNQYNGAQVPAAFVADSVTLLSNQWTDAKSFRNPCEFGTRTVNSAGETTVRAALLMGDTMSSLRVSGQPNQGGGDANLAGGVHNFPRFLESWGTRVNYCGSLINLFNSHQHNGAHKSGGRTYSPPTRNWVFDVSFLDPNRLPPGTPFFQYIQMTGFRQTFKQLQ